MEQTIRELSEKRDSVLNKKNETEMAVKIKDDLVVQLQAKIEEQKKELEEKDQEIQDSKSKSQRALSDQINQLKEEHAQQLQVLEAEKRDIE